MVLLIIRRGSSTQADSLGVEVLDPVVTSIHSRIDLLLLLLLILGEPRSYRRSWHEPLLWVVWRHRHLSEMRVGHVPGIWREAWLRWHLLLHVEVRHHGWLVLLDGLLLLVGL